MGKQDGQKYAVGDVLGAIHTVELAGSPERFERWLSKEHDIQSTDEFLQGYKFFVETSIRSFLNQVLLCHIPLLNEDFVLRRARFEGVKLAKIPITCEKTAFVDNVNEYRRRLLKADSWKEVREVLDGFSEEVSGRFYELFDKYALISNSIDFTDKEDLLGLLTKFHIYLFFNDLDGVHYGVPNGYSLSILQPYLREERLEQSFRGYAYTLQFVWSQLVDDELYRDSALNDLHDTERFVPQDNYWERDSEDRDDLDRFFGVLKTEMIQPLEETFGLSVFNRGNAIVIGDEAPQSVLGSLTEKASKRELTSQEDFDYQLLWYRVEFLEASDIFNGVTAFMSLLSGTVELKEIFADGESVHVCKIAHPVNSGNDYTYGVLVEARGSTGLTDYSGWILFYDCCGDYSGFAGSEHLHAESIIEEYQERGKIELRELELKKEEFKDLISDWVVGESSQLDLRSQVTHLRSKTRNAAGLVVELISHYYLSRQDYSSDKLDWNINLDSGDIDILVEEPDKVRVIECKLDPSNQDLEEEIKKLESKTKVQSKKFEKSVVPEFLFWEEPRREQESLLKSREIDYKVVKEIVDTSPEFKGKNLDNLRDALQKIGKSSSKSPLDDELEDELLDEDELFEV